MRSRRRRRGAAGSRAAAQVCTPVHIRPLRRMRVFSLLLLLVRTSSSSSSSFDFGWRFALGDQGFLPPPPARSPSAAAHGESSAAAAAHGDSSSFCNFGTNITGTQCYGLNAAPAASADECAASCCLDPSCAIWQFDASDPLSQGCWQGSSCAQNVSAPAWVSFVRDAAPPGPPSPVGPPCVQASLPCAPAFDDSAWRNVSTPHDFIVEGAPNEYCDRGHGYLCFNKVSASTERRRGAGARTPVR